MNEISLRPSGATDTVEHRGGSVIAAHVHGDDQIVYVSSGLLAVTTSAGVWSATPDRAVLTPAGMWHQHRVFGNSRVHALELTGSPHFELDSDAPIVFAVNGLLRALLIDLTDGRIPEVLAGEARALLVGLVGFAPPAGIRLPNPHDERLVRACALVEADLGENIPLSRLAAAVHVSERSLSRLFRTEFGATYPQWRNLVRVFHASIALLEDESSVTEVAVRFGWATPSAFITTFTRLIGQTPAAYQRGHNAH
ncbi:AraC family transcriptional regulator [Catenulispora pinisilvae]|uniref:AraC family transcriptional regulator n=1 Tax=Catenulispora pinisilvae TaxID=2705253 RepID=UPI001892392F|nr:AraC family transcriptional regulator [Catenulispora pinisilvae]